MLGKGIRCSLPIPHQKALLRRTPQGRAEGSTSEYAWRAMKGTVALMLEVPGWPLVSAHTCRQSPGEF